MHFACFTAVNSMGEAVAMDAETGLIVKKSLMLSIGLRKRTDK